MPIWGVEAGCIASRQLRSSALANRFASAQDLVPRAYVIAPLGANAITISSSFFDGPVSTDPTIPVTDFKARFDIASSVIAIR